MDIKPSTTKGTYVNSLTITTSMGPGVPLDITSVTEEAR